MQVFAATNGFLDRINVDRVPEFLDGLIAAPALRARRRCSRRSRGGDWSRRDPGGAAQGASTSSPTTSATTSTRRASRSTTSDAERDAARAGRASAAGDADGDERGRRRGGRRAGRGGGARLAHGLTARRQEPDRVGQEHPARSRARWRWSPPRACAAPSSASRAAPVRGRDPPDDAPGGRGGRRRGRRAADPPASTRPRRRSRILLVTGDRGLAGAFNSQILRAGLRAAAEYEGEGSDVVFYASGRRGVSSLTFRGREVAGAYIGFTDRPAYADAREIAEDLMAAYVDGEVDRVEIFYNGYISPLVAGGAPRDAAAAAAGDDPRGATRTSEDDDEATTRATTRSSSTSPTRRRSSSASSPTTSRSRSTARCSSRPRPSTARA